MGRAVMKPARHTVPERPEMLRVPTADVLPAAQILRRFEWREEVRSILGADELLHYRTTHYEFMSLLRPSNHSGQLSDVSLFCGEILGPPMALPPTFHCPPSCRLCQWQCPHDFWPSSE